MMQKLVPKSKRGQSSGRVIGIVMVILLIAALGGVIFGADGLANTNLTSNAPVWVVTLLTVGTGMALVRIIIR